MFGGGGGPIELDDGPAPLEDAPDVLGTEKSCGEMGDPAKALENPPGGEKERCPKGAPQKAHEIRWIQDLLR